MAGRLCPACLKNVDSPPDANSKAKPADQGVSVLAAQQKREGVAPTVMSEPNRSRSVEETIVPASSGNAIKRLAIKYESYEEVPWHRREPGALVFLLVLLFLPITVALCIIALTGDVYRKAYDDDGNLQVWGPGNKVAAVLILLIQCFVIYAVILIS
jgi:hypothetical protein